MFLMDMSRGDEKNNFPIRLPFSIENLSNYFSKQSSVDIDMDEVMTGVTKYIQHLPNLKSLAITSSFTWPAIAELHIESESLEELELPKEFNFHIATCIFPSLKQIRLSYYHDAWARIEDQGGMI
mmetsp:Transcript_16014/g.30218  ORF Transcript_16014/g.30218 Transcript_16014/m.30218 type:complete len:125 (-) Transcript_16014:1184-1558(-)